MATRNCEPPKHFTREAKSLWRRLVNDYEIEDEGGLVLVGIACQAHARAHEARLQIERDGITLEDRFGQAKAHPAFSVERDSLSLMVRTIRALALEPDDEPSTLRGQRAVAASRAAVGRYAPGPAPLAVVKGAGK